VHNSRITPRRHPRHSKELNGTRSDLLRPLTRPFGSHLQQAEVGGSKPPAPTEKRPARSLSVDSRPADGMVDGGEQRVQSEPLRERALELPAAFELDGAAAERRGQAQVAHPHSGHRLRIAADTDVDAEPRVAQTQIRLGK